MGVKMGKRQRPDDARIWDRADVQKIRRNLSDIRENERVYAEWLEDNGYTAAEFSLSEKKAIIDGLS